MLTRSRVAAVSLTSSLWILLGLGAAVSLASPTGALSTNEIILFTHASNNCTVGGRGLYLTGNSEFLGNWGFDDTASGYRHSAGNNWTAYSNWLYSPPSILLTANSDCDLTDNPYPGGGDWNDKWSSVENT
jgi:hypothetical protein